MQSTINAHDIVIATHYNVLDCHYAITESPMTDRITEKVAGDVVDVNEESNTAQSHSDSEDLFQRWYREGYDIYNEAYVRWLMVHHPGDVKSEWLTKNTTTSKSSEPDQPSEKSQVVLNYDSVFDALHRSKKGPQTFSIKLGPSKAAIALQNLFVLAYCSVNQDPSLSKSSYTLTPQNSPVYANAFHFKMLLCY